MKNKYLLTSFVLVCGFIILVSIGKNSERSYIPRKTLNSDASYDASDAYKWQNERRANPLTGVINIKDVEAARQQVEALSSLKGTSALNLDWENLGPDNVGGRTRALLVDKNNNQIIYAGGVAGGMWKSTTGGLSWQLLSDEYSSISISSICQARNGDIYFGTGEYFASVSGQNRFTNGSIGKGIWKKLASSNDFVHLDNTWAPNADTTTWQFVNELAASPSNSQVIFAGTNSGLWVTSDGGNTWTKPITNVNPCTDVKIAGDGTVIATFNNASGYAAYISPNGADGSFTPISSLSNETLLPVIKMGRIEFAFAPSDNNYIYCLAAYDDTTEAVNGSFRNVYLSKNKGVSWAPILDGAGEGITVFGNGNQGRYDNTIAVYPDNKNKIIVGGVDLWKWTAGQTFEQISYWQEWAGSFYVHADQHAIVFDPKYGVDNYNIYFANDGGVFRSTNGGITYDRLNKRYTTTAFYTVGFSGDGRVIGGTQDNGTQYIDYMGNTVKTAIEVLGGDGGGCLIPMLHPDVLFASVYYGQLRRSGDRENDMETTLVNSMIRSPWIKFHENLGEKGAEPFVTRVAMWESFYDTLSIDSVEFIAKKAYSAGEVIVAKSSIYKRPLYYTLTDTLNIDDTVLVHDTYQAAMAIGLHKNVWVTRYPLNFSKDWVGENWWFPVIDTSVLPISNKEVGETTALAWSKDGNYLYVGSENGRIYRVSNLINARTKFDLATINPDLVTSYDTLIKTQTQIIATFTQSITDIAVDPQNPNNIVVTLGNFGFNNHVYYSTNAATTTSSSTATNFVSVQGNLPRMPVYSAVINWDDSREIIIGTEYGVWSTDNVIAGSVTWTDQNSGIPKVPIYMLRQQTFANFWADGNSGVSNHGVLYAASYGRGLFKCETLRGPLAVEEMPDASKVSLGTLALYPNPVVENATVAYSLNHTSNVEIKVYDLTGKVVKYQMLANKTKGSHKYSFSASDLKAGTYIMNVKTADSNKSVKFIVN